MKASVQFQENDSVATESDQKDAHAEVVAKAMKEDKGTYGLTVLTSTPHDHISRTGLCLLSLLVRLIRLKSPLGSSK